jgi:hypothetical protein
MYLHNASKLKHSAQYLVLIDAMDEIIFVSTPNYLCAAYLCTFLNINFYKFIHADTCELSFHFFLHLNSVSHFRKWGK